MSTSWLRDERTELAAERILAAAERVFLERGVAATEMGHIAKAAGCSRATLYRYFENRHALRVAYVHREARRITEEIGRQVRGIADPRERLVEAVLAALQAVRGTPVLATWFSAADSAMTAELARSSEVIEAMSAAFVGDRARARWLVRIIVSLLTTPGADAADERTMIECFVAPVLVDS